MTNEEMLSGISTIHNNLNNVGSHDILSGILKSCVDSQKRMCEVMYSLVEATGNVSTVTTTAVTPPNSEINKPRDLSGLRDEEFIHSINIEDVLGAPMVNILHITNVDIVTCAYWCKNYGLELFSSRVDYYNPHFTHTTFVIK